MQQYSYEGCLEASVRVNWQIEDIIGGDRRLDFSKPFMPESLARVEGLSFLTDDERRILNQIRGHDYLYLFGAVEEFILPFVLDHARPQLAGDDYRIRALLQFAGEEAKHIHLFKCFRDEFTRDFGTECAVIGPPEAIGREVLSHHPLAVALAILQIEWMTQRHYTDSIKDNQDLDPQFKSLLKHHWMEEAQHAKLDALMVQALVQRCTPKEVEKGVDEYLEIGAFLDAGLAQQVEFDMQSLAGATGRTFNERERQRFAQVQQQANRWTFLGSGMTHPRFLETLGEIGTDVRKRIEQVSVNFC